MRTAAIREDLRTASPGADEDGRDAGADAGVDLLRAACAGEERGESLTLSSLWQANTATIDHDTEKT